MPLSSVPKKTSKMYSDFTVLCQCQNIPIFDNVLDVFSRQGDRIELIPFALSQASSDTSLDYTQGAFWRHKISDYFDTIPLLGEPEKRYVSEKNTFPMDLIA